MRCPVCKLELGVERRANEVVLTYSFKDWGSAAAVVPGPIRCGAAICCRPFWSNYQKALRCDPKPVQRMSEHKPSARLLAHSGSPWV